MRDGAAAKSQGEPECGQRGRAQRLDRLGLSAYSERLPLEPGCRSEIVDRTTLDEPDARVAPRKLPAVVTWRGSLSSPRSDVRLGSIPAIGSRAGTQPSGCATPLDDDQGQHREGARGGGQ